MLAIPVLLHHALNRVCWDSASAHVVNERVTSGVLYSQIPCTTLITRFCMSAIHKWPPSKVLSTAILHGILSCACVAGPPET